METFEDKKVDGLMASLQDRVSENIDLRLRLKGITRTQYAEDNGVTQGSISQKLNRVRDWQLIDIVRAASYFQTTFEGIVSDVALQELRKEYAETAAKEDQLRKQYLEAQKELKERYAHEMRKLQETSQRARETSVNERTPADVRPRFLVAPVPPVGFEPTTHDLKGRCSNR